jgi:hypothetical protein
MSVWFYLVFCSLIVVLTSDHGRQMVMMFVFLASPFARVEHAELLTVTVINNCTIEVFQQAVRLFRWWRIHRRLAAQTCTTTTSGKKSN